MRACALRCALVPARTSSSAFRVWGTVERAGVSLELRQALEPWLVLGEQSGAGGTARTVELLARARAGARHGRAAGSVHRDVQRLSAAAGTHRDRWAKPSPASASAPGRQPEGFHPTIAPHVPLTFDIVDTWTGRSIGGCRYHATHPGGRDLPGAARQRAGGGGAPARPLRAHRPHRRRAESDQPACTPISRSPSTCARCRTDGVWLTPAPSAWHSRHCHARMRRARRPRTAVANSKVNGEVARALACHCAPRCRARMRRARAAGTSGPLASSGRSASRRSELRCGQASMRRAVAQDAPAAQAEMLSDGDLTRGYRALAGGFDELVDASGAVRRALGATAARARRRSLRPPARCARSSSTRGCGKRASPTICSADPTSAAQPWRIDLVPLMVAPEEWRMLERALIQRARLFEGILADLYGPAAAAGLGRHPASARVQRPLLPAALPWSASRPAATSSSSPPTWPAGPDGRWRIIDTHTETPAGIGYALANRMVHTNVAGDIFVACQAMRLAPFFQQLQGALARRANRADPTIALLTPGPAPQRLLQPRLSCPLSRPAAGRGRRSARHRRPRLAQDAARPDADRPDRALRGWRRGRPAGARRVGLCRPGRPAAGDPPSSPTSWSTRRGPRSPRTAV